MAQTIKEVVLKGFDCNNPDTQDLVIWVSGDEPEIDRITRSIEDHILFIEDMDIGLAIGGALGIDFKLPKEEQAFLRHVENMLDKAS